MIFKTTSGKAIELMDLIGQLHKKKKKLLYMPRYIIKNIKKILPEVQAVPCTVSCLSVKLTVGGTYGYYSIFMICKLW